MHNHNYRSSAPLKRKRLAQGGEMVKGSGLQASMGQTYTAEVIDYILKISLTIC
jgi:hypothetical protein